MANALKIRTMPDGAEKTKFKQEIVASAKQLKKEEEAAKHAKQTKNTGLPHMHMDKFGHMLADPAPLPVQAQSAKANTKGSLTETDMESYADMICLCVKPQGQPCDWPLIDKKCQSAINMQKPTPNKCKAVTDKQDCRLVSSAPPHVHLLLNAIDTEQTNSVGLPYGNAHGAEAERIMRNMAKVHAPAPLLGTVDGPTVLQTMQTKLAIKQKAQAENKKLVKELGAKDHYRQAQERAAEAERKKKDAAFWNKVETQLDKKTPADLAKAKAKKEKRAELAQKKAKKSQAQADTWATSAKYRLKDLVVMNAKQFKQEEKQKKARREAEAQLAAANEKVARDKQREADQYLVKLQKSYEADLARERSEKQAKRDKERAVAEHNLEVEDAERKVKILNVAVKRDRHEHAVMMATKKQKAIDRQGLRIKAEKAAEDQKAKLLETTENSKLKKRKFRAASIIKKMQAAIPDVHVAKPLNEELENAGEASVAAAGNTPQLPLDKQLHDMGEEAEKDAKNGISPSEVADRKKMIEAAEREVQKANRVVQQDETVSEADAVQEAGNKMANYLLKRKPHQPQFHKSDTKNPFPAKTPAQMVTTNEISKTATRVSKTTTTAGPDDIFSPVSNKDIEDWKSSKKLVAEQNKIAQAKAEVEKANLAVKQDEADEAAAEDPEPLEKANRAVVDAKEASESADLPSPDTVAPETAAPAAPQKEAVKKIVEEKKVAQKEVSFDLTPAQNKEYEAMQKDDVSKKPMSTSVQSSAQFSAQVKALKTQQQQQFKKDAKADQQGCEQDCKSLQDWQNKAMLGESQLTQEPAPAVGAECDCEVSVATVNQLVEVMPEPEQALTQSEVKNCQKLAADFETQLNQLKTAESEGASAEKLQSYSNVIAEAMKKLKVCHRRMHDGIQAAHDPAASPDISPAPVELAVNPFDAEPVDEDWHL